MPSSPARKKKNDARVDIGIHISSLARYTGASESEELAIRTQGGFSPKLMEPMVGIVRYAVRYRLV